MARTAAVAGTATAVSNRVSRRQGNRWAEQDAQAYAEDPPPPPPAPVAAAPQASAIDQLKELGALKQQGILTEEEFTAQKPRSSGLPDAWDLASEANDTEDVTTASAPDP
jgi:hypothetical protein